MPPHRPENLKAFLGKLTRCICLNRWRGTCSQKRGGGQITAAGFVDGKLHVQAHYDDILKTDNHGYVYLLDADGGKTESEYSESFWDADRSGSYEEYVFNVRPEEISDYRIFGCFTTCSMLHEGKWQVTFLLD